MNQKGFAALPLIVILFLVALAIGGGSYWYSTQKSATPSNQTISEKKATVSADIKTTPSTNPSTTPTADSTSTDKFIVNSPLDLSQIASLSKFRSCAGHDYSGPDMDGINETNRSMKHYFVPVSNLVGTVGKVKEYAAFDGTISDIQTEQTPRGKQVWVSPDVNKDWNLIYFHLDLQLGLTIGSKVKAGDLIGYANLNSNGHDFDLGLKRLPVFSGKDNADFKNMTDEQKRQFIMQNKDAGKKVGPAIDSIFNHMSDEVLAQFQERGATTNNVIISKETRDKTTCNFNTSSDSINWITLK